MVTVASFYTENRYYLQTIKRTLYQLNIRTKSLQSETSEKKAETKPRFQIQNDETLALKLQRRRMQNSKTKLF